MKWEKRLSCFITWVFFLYMLISILNARCFQFSTQASSSFLLMMKQNALSFLFIPSIRLRYYFDYKLCFKGTYQFVTVNLHGFRNAVKDFGMKTLWKLYKTPVYFCYGSYGHFWHQSPLKPLRTDTPSLSRRINQTSAVRWESYIVINMDINSSKRCSDDSLSRVNFIAFFQWRKLIFFNSYQQ